VPWPDDDIANHFFDPRGKVFSDKLSKLAIRCNDRSGGAVIDRLSRVFPHVFVDEVQDLAGYDLDILEALARSPVRLLMVGDPRQVTYLTHNERRYGKYANGGIADFLRMLPKKLKIEVDDASLNRSHRNSAAICAVSSRLFSGFAATQACECATCRRPPPASAGVFILRTSDYARYLATVRPVQLRDKITSSGVDPTLPALNFGESKGRGFDHVVILPTGPMKKWLADPSTELAAQSRAKFYVALTRARHSVAVAMDWNVASLPAGFSLYEPAA
jgi:superfamily I DNA/RNA helicase